jgi:hypothetical protein
MAYYFLCGPGLLFVATQKPMLASKHYLAPLRIPAGVIDQGSRKIRCWSVAGDGAYGSAFTRGGPGCPASPA